MLGQLHLKLKQEIEVWGLPVAEDTQIKLSFVTGHDFSRAAKAPKRESALAPEELKWLKKKFRRG
jgi:hypothetical protein